VFFSNLVPLPVSVSFFLSSHDPSPLSLTVPLDLFSLPFGSFSFSSNPHNPSPLSLSPLFTAFPVFFLFWVPFLFVLFFLFSSFPLFFFFPTLRTGVESLFIGPRERGLFIAMHGAQGSTGLVGGRGLQGTTPPVSHHEGACMGF